ncbi:hypothetical protein [Streptomyces chromofuscus]|uniref:hypothetical protein n=1 Tax=Streptomyces chromofuscus TaxID=42881 RepID=UPI0019C61321|nr:hypothetical protein [Streptomyces chromofuscus]GGT31562.1 hypothetical protein GCM10010254_60110 [Streptomyces chromofuscus]
MHEALAGAGRQPGGLGDLLEVQLRLLDGEAFQDLPDLLQDQQKTCTVGVSLASVVAIVLLQPISLLF